MLTILNNGLAIKNGGLRYAWFDVQKDDQRFFRCVALRELQTIPVSERADYDLLGKQWTAVRGLYNAGVNFVYTSMGIYNPDHIGIVQYFGAAGEGASEDEAAAKAMIGMSTVTAVFANYPQSRLRDPNQDWLQWYLDFITSRAKNISAVLGHPDPREAKLGAASDGSVSDDSQSDLALEQNEILFRGLSKLRQNFVFQVLAEHISRPLITKTLIKISEAASNVASRRKGSIGIGFNLGIPIMAALTQGSTAGVGASQGVSRTVQDGVTQGQGISHGTSVGSSQSHSESQSMTDGTTRTVGKGTSHVDTESHTESSGFTKTSGRSSGGGWSKSSGWSVGFDGGKAFQAAGTTVPLLGGISAGYNNSSSVSGFSSTSSSTSTSSGKAHSTGTADGVSTSESDGTSHSTTRGTTDTQTQSQGENWGDSQNWGKSHIEGSSATRQQSQSTAQSLSGGLSTGLLPGISINRTWQTEDDVAERLADVLRRLESLVNQASMEGGFMTNTFVFTENNEGEAAASALVPQAFHGINVATPVLTIPPLENDEAELRAHAFSFTPWTVIDDKDPFSGELWTRYATLLTAGQLAAYTAPGLFEEGSAFTTMAAIPVGMGFYPEMPGDAVLGHQYSPETGDITPAQVRLHPDSLMHTMFTGDTGFGKSVAAIRTAYETTLRWKLRTVVLDFGAGWRSLLNAPGLEGHVEILQLWPDAVRPLRWNPMQIGRNIAPETQWRAFADVFGGIAQLGVKRQKQELLEAMRRIYIRAGVLVDDPEVRSDTQWGRVQPAEAAVAAAVPGTLLSDLNNRQRQAIAVQRSVLIGLLDLYTEIEEKLKSIPPRDVMLTGVLEGILFRLNPLVQGSAARQFAPGPGTVPVEDLSKTGGWGITIIEGGMFLDDFGKAFLLGWTGWHLYMDMVARRVHEVNANEQPILQIFYEEANKIFVKDQGGGGDDSSGGVSATQRFADMFRDARKYKSRLHVITQAPHLIADDIISSCNNLIVGYLKNPKDKDLILSALARSEKGFRDEEWRRFVDDIPISMAIGRFPYTSRRELQRPFLFRPLMLDVPEPSDEEIEAMLGRISL
ncbi:MAG: ATP-binding protein [Chloroflexi bacterium]|nr:ATP-binding protein [Chloroflexota bacterium]MBI3340765.1 ATP-binding protein [Chloroflexota bacterium]